jgi:hypothetical protein
MANFMHLALFSVDIRSMLYMDVRMGFVLELFFVLLRKFIPNWSAVVIMDHQ